MGRSHWHLPGKRVLITGVAGGIGSVTARLLAARQTHLSLLDMRGDALQQQARAFGADALCQEADITQRDALEAAVAGTPRPTSARSASIPRSRTPIPGRVDSTSSTRAPQRLGASLPPVVLPQLWLALAGELARWQQPGADWNSRLRIGRIGSGPEMALYLTSARRACRCPGRARCRRGR